MLIESTYNSDEELLNKSKCKVGSNDYKVWNTWRNNNLFSSDEENINEMIKLILMTKKVDNSQNKMILSDYKTENERPNRKRKYEEIEIKLESSKTVKHYIFKNNENIFKKKIIERKQEIARCLEKFE